MQRLLLPFVGTALGKISAQADEELSVKMVRGWCVWGRTRVPVAGEAGRSWGAENIQALGWRVCNLARLRS